MNPFNLNPGWTDQHIGSILEAWITRDTEGCRFCNEETDAGDDFCDEECEERFETVMDARLAIGSRDLEQRGYD